jgi:hypothetical protein
LVTPLARQKWSVWSAMSEALHAHAAEAVGERAGKPAAERRSHDGDVPIVPAAPVDMPHTAMTVGTT